MYITIVTRVDGKPPEKYPFRTKEEAEKQFKLFCKDVSGVYKSISIVDDVTNTILSTIEFQ